MREGLLDLAASAVSRITVNLVSRCQLKWPIYEYLRVVAPRHDPRRCSPWGCVMRVARGFRDVEEWFARADQPGGLDDPAFHRGLEKLFARVQWLDGANDPVVHDGLVKLANLVVKGVKKSGVPHFELWDRTWEQLVDKGAILRYEPFWPETRDQLVEEGAAPGCGSSRRKMPLSLYKEVLGNPARRCAWNYAKGVAWRTQQHLRVEPPKEWARQQRLMDGYVRRVAEEMGRQLGVEMPPNFLQLNEECQKVLEDILERADDNQKQVVILRLAGMSIEEIAGRLEVAERTVYRWIAALRPQA